MLLLARIGAFYFLYICLIRWLIKLWFYCSYSSLRLIGHIQNIAVVIGAPVIYLRLQNENALQYKLELYKVAPCHTPWKLQEIYSDQRCQLY